MYPVKRPPHSSRFVALSAVVLAACGGAQAPTAAPNEYGRRVSRCIAAPRAASDAAQASMIAVPAGQVIVGSSPQERVYAAQLNGSGSAAQFAQETPRRVETLPAFRIDRTAVTNAAFAEFVSACGTLPPDAETVTPQRWADWARQISSTLRYEHVAHFIWPAAAPPLERNEHPVVLVTHDDAAFYCAWRGARLPLELEWERAARGHRGQLFPWGDRFDARLGNTREGGVGDTTIVGSFDLVNSPTGAKDMGALVFEWTQTPGDGEPTARVVKGNSWNGLGGTSRAAARSVRPANVRDAELGFRCAADADARHTSTEGADIQ